ncbi:hypothetical protein EYF80_067762 [Liparis tanakae]|uniref:Uncharacterized protein n=1 Tax=Liparis tanakae TaxID=230148 RepID=A0A4Z2E032_9TELE|nr:hypothetical protein EYF80_067762 [Liparis tanakae]
MASPSLSWQQNQMAPPREYRASPPLSQGHAPFPPEELQGGRAPPEGPASANPANANRSAVVPGFGSFPPHDPQRPNGILGNGVFPLFPSALKKETGDGRAVLLVDPPLGRALVGPGPGLGLDLD